MAKINRRDYIRKVNITNKKSCRISSKSSIVYYFFNHCFGTRFFASFVSDFTGARPREIPSYSNRTKDVSEESMITSAPRRYSVIACSVGKTCTDSFGRGKSRPVCQFGINSDHSNDQILFPKRRK